jgi:hypothetical protein
MLIKASSANDADISLVGHQSQASAMTARGTILLRWLDPGQRRLWPDRRKYERVMKPTSFVLTFIVVATAIGFLSRADDNFGGRSG